MAVGDGANKPAKAPKATDPNDVTSESAPAFGLIALIVTKATTTERSTVNPSALTTIR